MFMVMVETKMQPHLNKEDPISFEDRFVTQVYDQIAPHFSSTRYKPWSNVERFLLNSCSKYSLVADVGCGNGKYMSVNKDLLMLGSDISEGLLSICVNKEFEVLIASNEKLPYRSESFDAVISVAVVHHFSTDARRQNAINELYRICKPGGKVLICVWAFEQIDKKTNQQRFMEQDVFVPWHLQKKFISNINNSSSDSRNIVSDAQSNSNFKYDTDKNERIYKRYYHLFKEKELEDMIEKCPLLDSIIDTHFECDNWIVVGTRKTSST